MQTGLIVKDLFVEIDGKQILKGLNINVGEREIVALIGPNGNGKSTLLSAIMGHPKYTITSGSITFNGTDILKLSVDERAKLGLFLGMQYPLEIPGVINSDFLRMAVNARNEKPVSLYKLIKLIEKATAEVGLSEQFIHRNLNEGFSGGEKKRNELLQMKLLNPKLAMLDEIDSGLDVDALKVVENCINDLRKNNQSCLIVSHYSRLYETIKVDKVCLIINGSVVKTGGIELVRKVDTEGYGWIKDELGIEIETKEEIHVAMASCAVKEKFKK